MEDAKLVLILNKGKANEYVLCKDTDFIVKSYANNINAGKATVVLEGIGGFSSTAKVSFVISPDESEKTLVYNDLQYYEKDGVIPQVTIAGLKEGIDCKVTCKNNKKLYTDETWPAKNPPAITMKFNGNYKGEAKANFRILPKDLSLVNAFAPDVVSSGKKGGFIPKITLTDVNGKKLSAGTDYSKTFAYFNADSGEELNPKTSVVPAGTRIRVEITESGKGNYIGQTSAFYRVIEKTEDISSASFEVRDQEYSGEAILLDEDDFTKAVLKDGTYLALGTDFEIVSYENNIKKGTAKVTLHGIGERGGYKTVSFRIIARDAAK